MNTPLRCEKKQHQELISDPTITKQQPHRKKRKNYLIQVSREALGKHLIYFLENLENSVTLLIFNYLQEFTSLLSKEKEDKLIYVLDPFPSSPYTIVGYLQRL